MKKYKKVSSISRVSLFLLCFTLLAFLGGCSSIPSPNKRKTSLLIIVERSPQQADRASVVFRGPEDFSLTLGKEKMNIHYLRLLPGEYEFRVSGKSPVEKFTLPPDTVFLFPGTFTIREEGAVLEREAITPELQKAVQEDMENYVHFYDWYGKSFTGFGPYVPRFIVESAQYSWEISTDPAGAQIYVDGENWGASPLTVTVEPGKHLIRIEKEGFQAVQTYIAAEGDGEYSIAMETVEEEEEEREKKEADESYALFIHPFENLGEAEFDRYNTLFSDGITAGIFDRPNIRIIEENHGEEERNGETSEIPRESDHMEKAEELGAELLISGSYLAKENTLFVSASLYDVRTGQVKTNIMYTGEAGLSIFDSIDEMTEEFLANISKVLPAVGKEVVRREQRINSEMVSYQKKISGKEIAAKRREHPHILSSTVSLGVMAPSNNLWFNYNVASVISGNIHYEWEFLPQFLLQGRIGYPFLVLGKNYPKGIPFHIGPGFSFPGKMVDFSLSPLGHFQYIPEFTALFNRTVGPLFLAGLSLDMNLKFYLTGRLDLLQHFLSFNLKFDIYQKMLNPADKEKIGDAAFGGNIYFGYGVRL